MTLATAVILTRKSRTLKIINLTIYGEIMVLVLLDRFKKREVKRALCCFGNGLGLFKLFVSIVLTPTSAGRLDGGLPYRLT